MESIRASCESCRKSKLKCIRAAELGPRDDSACQRCAKGGLECVYSIRAPTGRPPKKRKLSEDASAITSPGLSSAQNEPKVSKRRSHQSQGVLSTAVGAQSAVAWKSPGSPADTVGSDGTLHFSMASPNGNRKQTSLVTTPASSTTHTSGWQDDSLAMSIDPSLTTMLSRPDAAPWLEHSKANMSRSYPPQYPSSAASNPMAASLADLSLAAFLESLDDVELTSSEGLTESMLAEGHSSAIMTDANLAYAVPADFSWWNLNFTNPEVPAAVRSQGGGRAAPVNGNHSQQSYEGSPSSWPRGAKNGMGQGQIYRAVDGAVLHSAQWPEELPTTFQDKESSGAAAPPPAAAPAHPQPLLERNLPKADCCSMAAPSSQQPSCCSSEAPPPTVTEPERPEPTPTPCCCTQSGGDAVEHRRSSSPNSIKVEPAAAASTATRVHCVPNPSGRGCTCLCDASVALLTVRRTLRVASQNQGPGGSSSGVEGASSSNPGAGAGDGNAPPTSATSTTSASASASSSVAKTQANTLHLTLCASQAIASQCACSADCSTCRSDPSTTGISASLLVSTALQIYARAVLVLREGFGCRRTGGGSAGLGAASASASASGGGAGGAGANGAGPLDVRIGTYRPSETNARRIALYAMRLELVDLRDALGKVSGMARREGAEAEDAVASVEGGGEERRNGGGAGGVNPIDQLVIMKLYAQLGDVLHTVRLLEQE